METEKPVIEVVRASSAELLAAFRRLLPQLSSDVAPQVEDRLGRILDSETTHLLIAREHGVIVATLTLVVFPIPTGVRAWIEDVVADADARGRGVGAALVVEALRIAAEQGARSVDLTSNPSRAAANRLYQRLGFTVRNTNLYRFTLPVDESSG